ncbi:putative glucose-6-phosphate 1-epimerase [Trifolium repens]|nr:putative glucose-6-phosphate 1-epimerase [Trifolium repens]
MTTNVEEQGESVWNPWQKKSKSMVDCGKEELQTDALCRWCSYREAYALDARRGMDREDSTNSCTIKFL